MQDAKNRDDFYRVLRQGLKNHFDIKIESGEDAYTDFIEAMKHLYLERKNYVVFLIDEFDAFIENMATGLPQTVVVFLAELNKLLEGISIETNVPKTFSCVFTSRYGYKELLDKEKIPARGSRLNTEELELEWFSKEQVAALAHRYLRENTVRFSTKDIDFCFEKTWGYPYFVQRLFSIMYGTKGRHGAADSYFAEVEKEYTRVLNEVARTWEVNRLPQGTSQRFKDFFGKAILPG